MKLAFIGCGNMAKAMIGGVIKEGILKPEDVIASDMYVAGLEAAKEAMGIHITTDNKEAAKADIVVLAVKPNFYPAVVDEIKDTFNENQIVVTITPGYTLEKMVELFGKNVKVVRTMPNTPAMVGAGVTAVCSNAAVTEAELNEVCEILGGFGTAEVIPESLMDASIAATGSSPAFIFMLIEAMADGAVRDGFPRQQAYRLVSQAVLGSAKMVLETGKHPGELKDMVCTPGGITIEAVKVLEDTGLRSSILNCMEKCTTSITQA